MAVTTLEARLLITGQDKASAQIAAVTKATASAAKAMAEVGRAAKASADVERLNRQLQGTMKAAAAADAVQKLRGSVANAQMAFRSAEAQVKRTATALDAARASSTTNAQVVQRLSAEHRAATQAVRATAAAVDAQTRAMATARSTMNGYAVPIRSLTDHQRSLRSSIEATTRAIQTQAKAEAQAAVAQKAALRQRQEAEARRGNRREAAGALAAGTGLVAAHRGKQLGVAAVQSVADFDIAVRKQRAFTDIGTSDQAGLLAQARKIGQETQFSNIDVVKAQTASMQGLPASFAPSLKAEVAKGIVENVRNFSTLMETDLKDGSEIIRGYLQQTGKDISTKEKALAEANKATNKLVKTAKLGGMDGEDVKGLLKFGAASSHAAGVTEDTFLSMGALGRRGGLRGDEAGVFARAAAGKIVSPTRDGIAALNAAGIKHSDYVRMPDRLDTSALESQFKTTTGKSFTPAVRQRMDAINADKALIEDRAKYVAAVTEAAGPVLGKTNKGTVRASDSQVAAKAANAFYKVSGKSVDADGLLDAAMTKKMTLPQINAWLTDKHGGKGAITQRQWEEFRAARTEIGKAGEDPNYAADKAKMVMAGVGGSIENMRGSIENMTLQAGLATEGLIKFTADGIGKAVDSFSNMSLTAQQFTLALGGGAAVAGGVAGSGYMAKKLLGFGALGKSALALDGAAVAQVKAAVALEAAAIKLAGGSLPETAKDAAKVAAGGALGAGLTTAGVIIGGAAATVFAAEAVKNPEFAKAYTGDGTLDDGGMLGADPAGYGFGAGILNAPDHSVRLAPKMTMQAPTGSLTLGKDGPRFGLGDTYEVRELGKEAGAKAGEGIGLGLDGEKLKVEEKAKGIFDRVKDLFSQGIQIPLSFTSAEGGSGGGGGGGGGGLIQKASFGGGGGVGDSPGGDSAIAGLLGTGRPSGSGSGLGPSGGEGRAGSGPIRLGRGVGGGKAVDGTGAGSSWYEAVMRAEGTAGKDPYNVVLGNGKYGLPDKPLTDMSLREAYQFGRKVRGRHGSSSALGAFQIVGRTMKGHMPHVGLGWDDKFSPENQRKLAGSIRKREGWKAWEGFKVHPREKGRAQAGSNDVAADRASTPDERLVRGLDGKEGLDLGGGRMKMPDGSIRSFSPEQRLSDEALQKKIAPLERTMPEGSGMGGAADRMHQAVDRMEKVGWRSHHTVEVTAGAGLNARTTGMRASSSGPVRADVGITMPQVREA